MNSATISATISATEARAEPVCIGEYLIRRLLGEGGMGRVYEAEERLSRRRVALKVLRDELSGSEQARALFVSEMQILAHLEHENVVRSLASMEVDGKLCVALELLSGRTLRQALGAGQALPWPRAGQVALAVARALAAAHGQTPPVIHRDLKPENIMLTAEGGVKVMDFGIAKLATAAGGHSTHSAGTLQYMSPEQIDASPVDGRSDLYGLGLVLYEMLAGKAPFRSASPRELLNMQCTCPPPLLPAAARAGLPKGIDRLLFQLLEKEPGRRPASAQEVIARLEPFLPDGVLPDDVPPAGVLPDDVEPAAIAMGADKDDAAPQAHGADPRARAAQDTVALVGRVASPAELSGRASMAIIVSLALAAAGATYLLRSHAVASVRPAAPVLSRP